MNQIHQMTAEALAQNLKLELDIYLGLELDKAGHQDTAGLEKSLASTWNPFQAGGVPQLEHSRDLADIYLEKVEHFDLQTTGQDGGPLLYLEKLAAA